MNARSRLCFVTLAFAAVLGIGAPRLSAIECNSDVLQMRSPQPPGAQFGWSVDADGTWLAGGAPFTSEGGAVVMFGGLPTAPQRMEPPISPTDLQSGDRFGFSVSIDGKWLAVGAPSGDGSVRDSGVVYLFYNADGTSTWEQRAKLEATDAAPNAQFGFSVSLHGKTLVVGAPDDSHRSPRAGAAYVFELLDDVWSQRGPALFAAGGQPFDTFGASVAVADGALVVGAPFTDDPNARLNFGAAYVFARSQSGWSQTKKLTAADQFRTGNIQFGAAVAIHGARIAVGAPGDDTSGTGSGTAFVFSMGSWNRQELKPEDAGEGNLYGTSVDLDDGLVAVGAPSDGNGAAYLLQMKNESWELAFKVTQTVPGSFGQSVALLGKKVYRGGPSYPGDKAGAIAVCPEEPKRPNLQCTTAGPTSPVVADTDVIYKINVSNTGEATAKGLRLTLPTPSGLSFIPQPKKLCGKGFPCPLAPLPEDKSYEIEVRFRVPPSVVCEATPDKPILFTPTVSATGVPDVTCPTVETTIEAPKVGKLECDVTGPASANPGDPITYTVRVSNTGCDKVRDVVFDNPVPDGLSFLGTKGHNCSDLHCELGTIEPGRPREVEARFLVRDVLLNSVKDIAFVTGSGGTAATCSFETTLRETEIQAEGSIQEIPALSEAGAVVLVLLLAFLTLRRLRSA